MPSLTGIIMNSILKKYKSKADPNLTLADARSNMEKAAGLYKSPRNVSSERVSAGGVNAEWIIPKNAMDDKVLPYFHGGAFIMGSLNTHRALVGRIALAASTKALSVEYPLSPENPYPAALKDCLTAYRWLIEKGLPPKKIAVAGDSAGGNLALSLMLTLRESGEPLPAAAVLLSPFTDLTLSGDSYKTKAEIDPVIPVKKSSNISISSYYGDNDPRDPLISPLFADLKGLPPLMIHVGENEVLLDDSRRLAERVGIAGGKVTLKVWQSMWHVAPKLPEARHSVKEIGRFINTSWYGI